MASRWQRSPTRLGTNVLIGKRVAKAREAAGMNKADLAKAMAYLGWYPATVTRVEEGSQNLVAADVLPLATVLRVDPMSLLADQEPGTDSYIQGYRDGVEMGQALAMAEVMSSVTKINERLG